MIIIAAHGAIGHLDTGLFLQKFAHIVNPKVHRYPAGELLQRSGLLVRAGRTVAHWSGTYTVAIDGHVSVTVMDTGEGLQYVGKFAVIGQREYFVSATTSRPRRVIGLIPKSRGQQPHLIHKNKNTTTRLQSLILLIPGKQADPHQHPCSSKTRPPFMSPAS